MSEQQQQPAQRTPLTHWKKLTNPDYLGAYALEEGKDLVVTIRQVKKEMVTGPDNRKEECIVCYFVEQGIKPTILNVTNAKIISKLYNTPYIEEWVGLKIQLYVAQVKAFGEITDALRVRSIVPKEYALTVESLRELLETVKKTLQPGVVTRAEEILTNNETAAFPKLREGLMDSLLRVSAINQSRSVVSNVMSKVKNQGDAKKESQS